MNTTINVQIWNQAAGPFGAGGEELGLSGFEAAVMADAATVAWLEANGAMNYDDPDTYVLVVSDDDWTEGNRHAVATREITIPG